MAKYKLQEMPDVHNTGKRKVYPKMVTNRTLSRKEFVKKMQGYHRGIVILEVHYKLNSILCQEQRFQLLLAVLSKIFYTDRTLPIF